VTGLHMKTYKISMSTRLKDETDKYFISMVHLVQTYKEVQFP